MAVALIGNGFRAHVSAAGDSRDESSFSWSHDPGAPAGVFVAVFSGSITNQATGVTYGGQAMDLVAEAHVSGAEDTGTVALYFLGSDIPTGNQTIEVSRNNNSTRMGAIGAAVSADADTEIYADGIALLEGNGSVSEQNADDGLQSGDPDSLRFAAGWFGHGSPPSAGPNSEQSLSSYQWTSSNQSARVVAEAMGGNGPRPVGFSTATADERAIIHFAIREAQGGAPATATPSAISATVTVPQPSIQAGVVVTPATVVATVAVPQPSASGGVFVTPSAVVVATSVPQPGVNVPTVVSASVVSVVAAVPAAAAEVSATAKPMVIAVAVDVPAALARAGAAIVRAKDYGVFQRINTRLHIARIRRSLRRGFAPDEGWEVVSDIFLFDGDPTSTASHDQAMAAVAQVWADHQGSDAATLKAAINDALNAFGFRRPDGTTLGS